MNCINCGKDVNEGWKVCPFCLQPLVVVQKCKKCDTDIHQSWNGCPICGVIFNEFPEKPINREINPPALGSKNSMKVRGATFIFCWIPPGEFIMGTGEKKYPLHNVKITKGFWLGETEVTQGQWQALMGYNPSRFQKGDMEYPVESISWNDCQDFIKKMNAHTNALFRLPTEAEWEYACRAGKTGNRDMEEWNKRTETYILRFEKTSNVPCTHQVRTKGANQWGLCDMLGNVWEWCQDWDGDEYFSTSPITDPQGPETGTQRVQRGGSSWNDYGWGHYIGMRSSDNPDRVDAAIGFRLVLIP